jgi:hypothetical protein
MSIFSRLFNKSPDSESAQQSSADEQAEEEQADGKASMRPQAPSFQINAPNEDASSSGVAAAPVMQVGAGDKRIARSSRPPKHAHGADPARSAAAQRSPAQGAAGPAQGAKPRPGSSTMVMGSNFIAGSGATFPPAPAPYAAPPSQDTNKQSWAQKPAASQLPNAAQRAAPPIPAPLVPPASPPAAQSHVPASRTGSRPKLQKDAADFAVPKPPPRGAPLPREEPPDELLTLELGSSQSPATPGTGRIQSNKATSQGLAPFAKTAYAEAQPAPLPFAQTAYAEAQPQPAAPPPTFTDLDPVGNLVNDLDAAFGAIVESANGAGRRLRPSEAPPPNTSVTELRELFTALAANHMRQVRDFMIGVKWGEAPRDWIGLCGPAVMSLQRASKEMELADLHAALEAYSEALRVATEATGATIAGDAREGLLLAYTKLAELMPDAFGLDGERGKREAIIVHALLQMVPEMRKNTIDKLYAAGLSSLDTLFVAKADEISATTGITEALASTIVERIKQYREESVALADATRAAERQRLGEVAAEMRQLHAQFELAASDWSDDAHARKKQLRQARAETLLQVKVLLARLGEVDRLGELERLPFERKIEQIEVYLREAAEARQAPPT